MSIISRGFSGRKTAESVKLPPGQYLTTDFPVLSAGPTPRIPLDRWEFTIRNENNALLRRWDWKSFRELPTETPTVDLHCVTRWSKPGTTWEGVSLDALLAGLNPDASFVMAHSYGGYSTNIPLDDLKNEKAWIAFRFDGKDLAPEHGGPARLLLPHLYLWKSAKWVRGLQLMRHEKPGFLGRLRLSHLWRSMEGATILGRQIRWRVGTVVDLHDETATARTLTVEVPEWPGHLAGQRVEVRLTAADGYSAVRSYSIASAPNSEGRVQITVERLPNDEVSPYLTQVIGYGDHLELRGPIGGWFVWRPEQTEPIQLIAGGSGIVPLTAMIRSRMAAGRKSQFRLLYSVCEPEAVFYKKELRALAVNDFGVDITYVYTRKVPLGWPRPAGRIDAMLIATATWPFALAPTCYVCGPTLFVESVNEFLTASGHDRNRIKTERFGATGGSTERR